MRNHSKNYKENSQTKIKQVFCKSIKQQKKCKHKEKVPEFICQIILEIVSNLFFAQHFYTPCLSERTVKMKKLIFAILLILTACQEQAGLNITEPVAEAPHILTPDDVFISARWDSKIPCNERSKEQVYADIRVSRRLAGNYVCEYRRGGEVFGNGTFEKGIIEDIYIGRGNVFQNHTIKLCCNGLCAEAFLINLCSEAPKLVERDVLEQDFTLSEDEVKYFYFTASEHGDYLIYVNNQCSACDENYFNLEIMTKEECDKKKNSEPYKAMYGLEHKWSTFTHFSQAEDTELCIAVIHNDPGKNVTKHMLVKGSWIE